MASPIPPPPSAGSSPPERDASARDVLDLLPDAWVLLDLDGVVVHANPAFARLVGGDIVGRTLHDFASDPGRVSELVGLWGGSSAFRPGAVRLTSVEGGRLDWRCDGARIPSSTLILVRARDRSVAVRPFEALSFEVETRNLREMKQRLERSLAELEAANVELARTNAELERYASVVSHDLRTPLATITGYAELLRTGHEDGLDDEGVASLDAIVRNAQRMDKVISALLSLAKLDVRAGERDPIDSSEALASAVDQLEGSGGLAVTTGTMLDVAVDRTHLIQLFQNLLGNSAKFSDPDRPPKVHVTSRTVNGRAEFTVTDNGLGIPEEERDRVFDLLQRGRRVGGLPGSGIGLTTCRRIVEAYGGSIRAEGPREDGPFGGTGTVFVFTLPT